MYVFRAVQLLIVCAMFYAVLFVAGKVPAPDMGRVQTVTQGFKDATTGTAATAGEAAGSAVGGYYEKGGR